MLANSSFDTTLTVKMCFASLQYETINLRQDEWMSVVQDRSHLSLLECKIIQGGIPLHAQVSN